MVKKLNLDQNLYKDYLGLILCEENYSKTKELGTVAIVFFDVNELKPVFIKHVSFKPGGIGFYYYWSVINSLTVNSIKKLENELGK